MLVNLHININYQFHEIDWLFLIYNSTMASNKVYQEIPFIHTWADHVSEQDKIELNRDCPLVSPGIRLVGDMECDELEISYHIYDSTHHVWKLVYYFLESN